MNMNISYRIPKPVLAFVFLALAFSGCVTNEWEECEKKGNQELSSFIGKENIPESSKKESGLYYIEDTLGNGLSPAANNFIVVNYTGKYLDGTVIETTDSSLQNSWDAADLFTDYVYGPAKFIYGRSRPGFNEGISYMKEGGWATLIMPTELAYYDCRPVEYTIQLLSVIKDPVAYEDSILRVYLAENGFDSSTTAYKDIYYKEYLTSGDTMKPMTNDTLLVRFVGNYTYCDKGNILTKEFDSNLKSAQPLKIFYGNQIAYSGAIKGMPPGFVAALDTMRKGTRAVAVLPYEEGFGTGGMINKTYGYYIVPQYQTVIYDLYLVDIIRRNEQ